jgi:hypothetical protein
MHARTHARTHAQADYAKMGEAVEATGRGIYYIICGCKLAPGDPDPRSGWEQCPRDA